MLVAKLASSDTDEKTRVLPLEDDIFAFRLIDKKILDFELELFATKWFDYRQLTGVQATKVYIEAYAEAYKEVYARELDYERAPFVKPVDYEKLMGRLAEGEAKAKKSYKGFWRGRQVADALGMPYRIYIDLAFTARMRRWKQRFLPQPWHLYHEYDVEKIQLKWIEQQETILFTSEDPAYLVQNYRGAAHQNDYHEWLITQAMARSNPASYLARFIDEHQLQLEKVQHRVPDDIYERVEALIS